MEVALDLFYFSSSLWAFASEGFVAPFESHFASV